MAVPTLTQTVDERPRTPAGDSLDADSPDRGADDATGPPGIHLGVVVGGLVGVWGVLIGVQSIYDNSFLTHLATGRLILERGGIPRRDPFSFTAPGEPWVVQSWLASIVYAVADRLGGLGGVRVLTALMCGLLALVVWLLSARSKSLLVRGAVVTPVMIFASTQWVARPFIFGLLGLGAVLLALDGRLDPRWLVAVMWVWVNTHGSFPFALLVVALVAVGTRLDTGGWGDTRRVSAFVAAGTALSVLNPLGVRLLAFPTVILGRLESFGVIVEWQAPHFTALDERVVLLLFVVTLTVLARRPSWRSALPVAVFGVLGMTSLRNLAPLCLVLVPALAGAFPDAGRLPAARRRRGLGPVLAVLLVVAVTVPAVMLGRPHASLEDYPIRELEWMEANGITGPDARVVSPDYVGNLREAQLGVDADVYIDDRVDMYPTELVAEYQRLLEGEPGWGQALARRRATAVLWPDDEPLAELLAVSPDWRIVRRTAKWIVAVPRG